MKLTAKARYAVTAMVDLAIHGVERPVALSEIAVRQDISLSFLEQMFRQLKASELVSAQRGAPGGYKLERAAAEIRVSDIIAAVQGPLKTTACDPASGLGCKGTSARCLTHDLWDELGRHVEVFMNSVSLEDIIEKRVLGRAMVSDLFPMEAAE